MTKADYDTKNHYGFRKMATGLAGIMLFSTALLNSTTKPVKADTKDDNDIDNHENLPENDTKNFQTTDHEQVKINYVDEHDHVIASNVATGKKGEPIQFSIPKGYHVKNENDLKQTFNNQTEIKITVIKNVVPEITMEGGQNQSVVSASANHDDHFAKEADKKADAISQKSADINNKDDNDLLKGALDKTTKQAAKKAQNIVSELINFGDKKTDSDKAKSSDKQQNSNQDKQTENKVGVENHAVAMPSMPITKVAHNSVIDNSANHAKDKKVNLNLQLSVIDPDANKALPKKPATNTLSVVSNLANIHKLGLIDTRANSSDRHLQSKLASLYSNELFDLGGLFGGNDDNDPGLSISNVTTQNNPNDSSSSILSMDFHIENPYALVKHFNGDYIPIGIITGNARNTENLKSNPYYVSSDYNYNQYLVSDTGQRIGLLVHNQLADVSNGTQIAGSDVLYLNKEIIEDFYGWSSLDFHIDDSISGAGLFYTNQQTTSRYADYIWWQNVPYSFKYIPVNNQITKEQPLDLGEHTVKTPTKHSLIQNYDTAPRPEFNYWAYRYSGLNITRHFDEDGTTVIGQITIDPLELDLPFETSAFWTDVYHDSSDDYFTFQIPKQLINYCTDSYSLTDEGMANLYRQAYGIALLTEPTYGKTSHGDENQMHFNYGGQTYYVGETSSESSPTTLSDNSNDFNQLSVNASHYDSGDIRTYTVRVDYNGPQLYLRSYSAQPTLLFNVPLNEQLAKTNGDKKALNYFKRGKSPATMLASGNYFDDISNILSHCQWHTTRKWTDSTHRSYYPGLDQDAVVNDQVDNSNPARMHYNLATVTRKQGNFDVNAQGYPATGKLVFEDDITGEKVYSQDLKGRVGTQPASVDVEAAENWLKTNKYKLSPGQKIPALVTMTSVHTPDVIVKVHAPYQLSTETKTFHYNLIENTPTGQQKNLVTWTVTAKKITTKNSGGDIIKVSPWELSNIYYTDKDGKHVIKANDGSEISDGHVIDQKADQDIYYLTSNAGTKPDSFFGYHMVVNQPDVDSGFEIDMDINDKPYIMLDTTAIGGDNLLPKDQNFYVNYQKINRQLTIHYIDDEENGKELGTDTIDMPINNDSYSYDYVTDPFPKRFPNYFVNEDMKVSDLSKDSNVDQIISKIEYPGEGLYAGKCHIAINDKRQGNYPNTDLYIHMLHMHHSTPIIYSPNVTTVISYPDGKYGNEISANSTQIPNFWVMRTTDLVTNQTTDDAYEITDYYAPDKNGIMKDWGGAYFTQKNGKWGFWNIYDKIGDNHLASATPQTIFLPQDKVKAIPVIPGYKMNNSNSNYVIDAKNKQTYFYQIISDPNAFKNVKGMIAKITYSLQPQHNEVSYDLTTRSGSKQTLNFVEDNNHQILTDQTGNLSLKDMLTSVKNVKNSYDHLVKSAYINSLTVGNETYTFSQDSAGNWLISSGQIGQMNEEQFEKYAQEHNLALRGFNLTSVNSNNGNKPGVDSSFKIFDGNYQENGKWNLHVPKLQFNLQTIVQNHIPNYEDGSKLTHNYIIHYQIPEGVDNTDLSTGDMQYEINMHKDYEWRHVPVMVPQSHMVDNWVPVVDADGNPIVDENGNEIVENEPYPVEDPPADEGYDEQYSAGWVPDDPINQNASTIDIDGIQEDDEDEMPLVYDEASSPKVADGYRIHVYGLDENGNQVDLDDDSHLININGKHYFAPYANKGITAMDEDLTNSDLSDSIIGDEVYVTYVPIMSQKQIEYRDVEDYDSEKEPDGHLVATGSISGKTEDVYDFSKHDTPILNKNVLLKVNGITYTADDGQYLPATYTFEHDNDSEKLIVYVHAATQNGQDENKTINQNVHVVYDNSAQAINGQAKIKWDYSAISNKFNKDSLTEAYSNLDKTKDWTDQVNADQNKFADWLKAHASDTALLTDQNASMHGNLILKTVLNPITGEKVTYAAVQNANISDATINKPYGIILADNGDGDSFIANNPDLFKTQNNILDGIYLPKGQLIIPKGYYAYVGNDPENRITSIGDTILNYDSEDSNIIIHIAKDQAAIPIEYIDSKTGEVVTQDEVKGDDNTTVNYQTSVPTGYKLADNQKDSRVKLTGNGQAQLILSNPSDPLKIYVDVGEILVSHKKPKTPDDLLPLPDIDPNEPTPEDYYPTGLTQIDLNRTLTRTIIVNLPSGSKTITQRVNMYRDARVNPNTKDVVYGYYDDNHTWHDGWTYDGKDHFDEYLAPQVDKYRPTISVVNSFQPREDYLDQTIVINYTNADKALTVVLVDDDNTGREIARYHFDSSSDMHISEPKGYNLRGNYEDTGAHHDKVVSGDYSDLFNENPNHVITLHYTEDIKDVTNSDPLAHTKISRQIVISQPNGTRKTLTMTQYLTRKAYLNQATGETRYGLWEIPSGNSQAGKLTVYDSSKNDTVYDIAVKGNGSLNVTDDDTGDSASQGEALSILSEFGIKPSQFIYHGQNSIEMPKVTVDSIKGYSREINNPNSNGINLSNEYIPSEKIIINSDKALTAMQLGSETQPINGTQFKQFGTGANDNSLDQNLKKTITVSYNKGMHEMTYLYVDSNGRVVGGDSIVGADGQTISLNNQVPEGYKLVDKHDNFPDSYTLKGKDNETFLKQVVKA